MARDKFKTIDKFFHLFDNDAIPQTFLNKIEKIKPIID